MKKAKNMRKRLFVLVLALAMVFTSVSVPSVTAEAAKNVKVKKVQITNPKKKKVTLVKGKTLQIKVKVTPKNARNKKVTYKSSKKKIASVTKKGKVKGLKKGTAKITVTAKDGSKKKATLTVKVVNPVKVTKVKLNQTAAAVNVGGTVTLKATCTPTKATNKAVSWKTSNKGVATVTAKGVVKGVKAGTATITATAKDGSKKKASCTVTVKAAAPTPNPSAKTLEGIAVTKAPTKSSYYAGGKFDPAGMEVTASYSDKSTKILAATAYTLTPSAETALKISDKAVTVSYTEGGVTKTATTPITVTKAPKLEGIAIKTGPTKNVYEEGEKFDPTGMVVEATYSDGSTKAVTSYTYPQGALEVTAGAQYSEIVISYTESGKTVTAEAPVTVKAKDPLESISAQLKQTELSREGACFTDDDVKVTATFKSGKSADISVNDCVVNPAEFTRETTSATITYWYGGIDKSVEVNGFTVTAYSEMYTFEDKDTIGTIVKRKNDGDEMEPTQEDAANVKVDETDFVKGVKGKALKLDGTYGLRLDKIAGTKSKNYSICAWFKPEEALEGKNALKQNQPLIVSTASKFGFETGMDETWCGVAANDQTKKPGQPSDNKIKLWWYDKDSSHTDVGTTANPAPIGTGEDVGWTHIALVVDDSGEKAENYATGTLYVNGKKICSGKVRNEKGELMKTYLGVNAWAADGYYKGLIDELVFTNEVLTQKELEKYYLEGAEGGGASHLSKITTVSPGDGEKIEVEYGTSLADVKRELARIAYKAAAEDEVDSIKTTEDMWTVKDYTTSSAGNVQATVTLQAPEGYIFNIDGKMSVTIERKVTVKVKDPITVTAVTPSKTALAVPFGTTEEAIKEELAGLTFAVTTEPDGTFEFENLARKWTLTKTETGYTAVFDLGTPEVGYKIADNLAVSVNVTVAQAIKITGLTATPDTLEVAYGTPEAAVKAELAKLAIGATVAADGTVPEGIENKASLWTLTNYTATKAGSYKAEATFDAPVGYEFSDPAKAKLEVTVTVAAAGGHVLSSLVVETAPTKTKYIEGDDFDQAGMVVKAYFADGQSEDVTAKATLAEATNMALSKTAVTISYTAGEVTKTCEQEISVVKVEDGAAAHYTFDDTLENAVDKTKVGKTVKNKDLTASTVTDIYSEDGIGEGKSLKINKDNAVEIPESISKDQKAFTINLWVKKSAGTTSFGTILMGKTDTGVSDGKGLVLYANPQDSTGEIEMQVSQAATTPFSYNWKRFNVPMEQWKMLTFVNRQDGMDFYIDGVQQELTADDKKKLSVTNGIDSLFLGAGKWTAKEYLVGNIDEVRIYDSSLKESQVKALYDTVIPVISGFSVDAKQDDFTFLKDDVAESQKPIQDALKRLKINVAMKNGTAPEIKNDTDWELVQTADGYAATKKITIPKGYGKVEGLDVKLRVDVIVKDIRLESIALTKQPTKVNYAGGKEFDPTGMVVTATYSNGDKRDVTKEVEITEGGKALTPDDGTAVTGEQTVTISLTEGGVAKTVTLKITVINPSTPKGAMLAARTAYYTFDGTLEDSVKNNTVGKTVKLTGYNTYADTNLTNIYSGQGIKGKSLDVKQDVGVEIPESISKADREFTINLWVQKKAGTAAFGAIFHGKNETDAHGKGLVMYANPSINNKMDNTKIQLETNGGSSAKTFALSDDSWAMLTFVNTKDSMEYYINGTAVNLTAEEKKNFSVKNEISRMILGIGQWNAADVFVGNIDEVSIYDASLTAEQVTLLKEEVQPASGQ